MKALLSFVLLTVVTSAGHAAEKATIQCAQENEYKVSTLEKREPTMFGCEGFATGLNVCFTGESTTALKILKGLNDDGVLGDEYDMRRIRARKEALKYDAFDATEGEVVSKVAIPRCSGIDKRSKQDVKIIAADSKNSCANIAISAVTLARKKSTSSAFNVDVGLISEDDQAAFFKVELVEEINDGASTDYLPADTYEVVMKSANCEVIAVREEAK